MTQSLAHLFSDRVRVSKSDIALKYKEHRGPYKTLTWSDFGAQVKELAFGLCACQLDFNSCVAIIANTSLNWVLADQAILACGAVSVPIYPTSSSTDIEYILNNAEAKVIFVENENLLERILSVQKSVSSIKKIILMTAPAKGKSLSDLSIDKELVIGLEELLQLGQDLEKTNPTLLEERLAKITNEDLATIIYTSGTTGIPKGVMLSHKNILSVVESLPTIIPLSNNDIFLASLPLSHVFERVCGEFYWIKSGTVCAFAEGIEYLAKNINEIQPTHMLVVPRILDKIYNKMMTGVDGASQRAKDLITWAIAVGKELEKHKNEGRPLRKMLLTKHWFAQKLVLGKLRERIGVNLKMIVTGGAPATAEVIEFFNAIGITVLEGYGLSETAAPTNVNRVTKNKYGTVGPALPGVEVKIADDGEICFKGPSIFSGYYNNQELTTQAFSDGWFLSGDIGELDDEGYLKITDRKKDIIVNSSGKNIAPQKIENRLKTISFVSQAIVFGDKKKTLVALFTLDETTLTEFAKEQGWSFKDKTELLASQELNKYLMNEISIKCKPLADYEQVRNFAILKDDLSIEEGELTATLKVRRNVLKNKYQDLIESLYKEEAISAAGKQT